MSSFNLPKLYLIYALHCKTSGLYYIGSTSNLSARLNTHLSSFKCGVSKCYSTKILSGNNYELLILKNNIQTKQEAKKSEYDFICAYGDDAVNKNKPILIDMKTYHKKYYLQRKNSIISSPSSSSSSSSISSTTSSN